MNGAGGADGRRSGASDGADARWFAADGLALELLGSVAGSAGGTTGATLPSDPTLAAAVALSAREPLLGCLERWLGETLDWTPWPLARPDAAVPTTPATDLVLRRRVAPEEAIGLRLDASRLTRLAERARPPDADIEGIFRRVTVDVLLDELALGVAETSALVPGAVLLLPAAFAERWRSRLVAQGDEVLPRGLEVVFDPERGRAERRVRASDGHGEDAAVGAVGAPPATDAAGTAAIDGGARVLIERPLELELPRWHALEAGRGDGALDVPGAGRARVVLAERVLHGTLARLGRGWAVRLDPPADDG